MENQITFWDYHVFTEVRVGRVHKDLKSKPRLPQLECELAEGECNEVALCSLESVAKEQSYHGPPTDGLAFSLYGVSRHNVCPYFHFHVESIFLLGMVLWR